MCTECIQSPAKHVRRNFLQKYLTTESRYTFPRKSPQKSPPSMFDRALNRPQKQSLHMFLNSIDM